MSYYSQRRYHPPQSVYDASTLTYDRKVELYRAGRYQFKPPVPHDLWGERDWINYIDGDGRWCV